MHQKIIDYQRHTVEFSSITPTATIPTPPAQKPSQGDPTNPTTPTPKPQNHDPKTSQQNQPTTPPPKSSSPANLTRLNQIVKSNLMPAGITITPGNEFHESSQFLAPNKGNSQKFKHSSDKRQIMPPAIPQRNHQNSYQPHTHRRGAEKEQYTHPTASANLGAHRPLVGAHYRTHTTVRGPLELAVPGRICRR